MNNQLEFICFCNQKIPCANENKFQEHIKNCQKYSHESPIGKIFVQIPLAKLEVSQLIALKYEYLNYIETLENDLKNRGHLHSKTIQQQLNSVPQNEDNDVQQQQIEFKQAQIPIVQQHNKKDQNWGLDWMAKCMITCQRCQREFYDFDVEKYWYLDVCLHLFCKGCLIKQINQDYINNNGEVKCLDQNCQELLTQYDYTNLVDKDRLQLWNEKIVEKNYNIIQCSKCPYKFQFAPGQIDLNIKGPQGKLTKYLAQHYAENRFTCPECKAEQCKGCKVSPYHIGFTCEEWIKNQNAKHCRYCEIVISKANTSAPLALQDICPAPECQQKAKMACQKILPCSHSCAGYLNEAKCLDCLNDDCAEKNPTLLGQKGSDYCNICFIEGLSQSPSIQLKSCGHIFHFHCIQKRLEIRWHRPRITFTFCLCPLCKKWMEFPADSSLQVKMQESMALFEKIKTMSLQRLKHEDRDKDERLKKQGDPYFNKPMEYAIAIYSYYMCFKCKNPYFGGLKSCENMMDEEKGKEGFDPKELVCANCCEVTPIENCPKHGKDFIEFKCKFCCSIAQWFCWGTTHFCDPCHKKQAGGDYLTKYAKDKLPKCPGKAKCPLQIEHKPNGEECALGCSLCRNMKENQKEF